MKVSHFRCYEACACQSGADEVGPGLKSIFEMIDNRTDFKSYMQNYAVARGSMKGPRREGPYDEGFVSHIPSILNPFLDKLASTTPTSCPEIDRQLGFPSRTCGPFKPKRGIFHVYWDFE